MSTGKIYFFREGTHSPFEEEASIKKRLLVFASEHGYTIRRLNYIFCTDEYLLQINQKYLNHDTLTDIITFDHSEADGLLEGDIFISLERVKENARKYKAAFKHELSRVMAHGLLHLMGYKDKTQAQKKAMRSKEDAFLIHPI